MSKADHAQSTSPPNRRSILAVAGGIAAAAALPVTAHAVSPQHSAEFLELKRMVTAGEWVSVFQAKARASDRRGL